MTIYRIHNAHATTKSDFEKRIKRELTLISFDGLLAITGLEDIILFNVMMEKAFVPSLQNTSQKPKDLLELRADWDACTYNLNTEPLQTTRAIAGRHLLITLPLSTGEGDIRNKPKMMYFLALSRVAVYPFVGLLASLSSTIDALPQLSIIGVDLQQHNMSLI